jgi:hypothetical protein
VVAKAQRAEVERNHIPGDFAVIKDAKLWHETKGGDEALLLILRSVQQQSQFLQSKSQMPRMLSASVEVILVS